MNAPDRAAWLAKRQKGIGGSDLAALLGLSPYKTPFALWQEKTGRAIDVPSPEAEERMHWGTVLEDVVAKHYAATTGQAVQRINRQLQHPDYPLMLGNVDRVVVQPGSRARWDDHAAKVLGASAVLELKTASAFAASDDDAWGEAGTDQVPQHYWMQVQHYLGVTGLPVGDVAVLFGGQQYRVYNIEADHALQRDLFAQATAWWRQHVEADVPPQPQTEAEARKAWARDRDQPSVLVDADTAAKVQELADVKARIKALEEREQALRDAIFPAFGDAPAIMHMGQTLATWKAGKDQQITDWEEIANEVGFAHALFEKHTTTKPGARVLRLYAPKN